MNVVASGSNLPVDHVALSKIKSRILDDPHHVFRSWNDSLPFCMWRGVTCNRRNQRVTSLNLTGEDLVGGIPRSISNLTSLENLFLSENPLGGSIPNSFNQLKELRELGLRENGLFGVFPSSSFNLSRLEFLDNALNQLQGTPPTNLCLNLPHLRILEIDCNNYNGFLPPSISNCSRLEIFDAGTNDFKGEIKTDLGKLQKLQCLGHGNNNFEMDCKNLFDSLSNCSNLETLALGKSGLTGALPKSFGNFTSKLNFIGLSGIISQAVSLHP
ncbi:uncharacterized protein LOC143604082 [Bidens hawaiensis]|uniref:uncharacterized protein LOC143604082 n=1 Tax=Bidens hawaiensis TaxID=980011 RepID=UPI00404B8541